MPIVTTMKIAMRTTWTITKLRHNCRGLEEHERSKSSFLKGVRDHLSLVSLVGFAWSTACECSRKLHTRCFEQKLAVGFLDGQSDEASGFTAMSFWVSSS